MGVDVELVLINFKRCNEEISPAYESFAKSGNTQQLITLLHAAIKELPKVYGEEDFPLINEDMLQEDIQILAGTTFYSSDGQLGDAGQKTSSRDLKSFTQEIVGPQLVEVLCVARDREVRAILDTSRTQLMPYLYDHSHWIKNLFAVQAEVSGGTLSPGMGETTQIFSPEELRHFREELSKIAPPSNKQLLSEFENLTKMLNMAAQDPSLRVALNIR